MASDLTRLQGAPTPGEIAGRNTDPRFYYALSILPNPDPILRKAGKSEEVYDAIQADAHVIGELRSIKAAMQRFPHSLTVGGEKRIDQRAFDLCQSILDREPSPLTDWTDVFWNIAQSTFRGMSVQEIVWDRSGDLILPVRIEDRPRRRFQFDGAGELRILTRTNLFPGVLAEEKYFLVDRHMPSYDNPYGVPLFSSCFWPYVFKHGGFRWFVKFCERFGVPFPVGKFPLGSSKETIDALEAGLENLIEAGYAAIEEGGDISLMESKGGGSGKLAQHQLIETCNAEISKALTSQTLASEITSGSGGSRAASQTHAERNQDVNDGDRTRIAKTLNKLWALITLVNLGPDAKPPTSDFVGDEQGSYERAQTYQIFTQLGGKPSRKAMADDLGIALADETDPDDLLDAPAPPPAAPGLPGAPAQPGAPADGAAAEFAKANPEAAAFPDQTALDAALNGVQSGHLFQAMGSTLAPVLELLQTDPQAALGMLGEVYTGINVDALAEKLSRIAFAADVLGQAQARPRA